MRFLILGDVIGQPGMRAAVSALSGLARRYRADLVIVNGENADNGLGITGDNADQLLRAGAHVITTGNHVWRDEKVGELLQERPEVLRPDNYPPGVAGSGVYTIERKQGSVAVINLQGRDRMVSIDCPFRRYKEIMKRLGNSVDHVVIDFHAEATAEKEAFAHYVDGEVTVVFGTHTHVPTADERILPGGCAYITDTGACCVEPSVIGSKPEISLRRALTQLPLKNEVSPGAAVIRGLFVETGERRRSAATIERVLFRSLV